MLISGNLTSKLMCKIIINTLIHRVTDAFQVKK